MNWLSNLIKVYHHPKGIADIYGVILYTDLNVHVKKMLNDDDYWKALDLFSGERWIIFAVRAAKGEYKTPTPNKSQLAFLVPIWKEPEENKLLLSDFDISSTKELPVFIVFTQDDDENILKNTLHIDDTSIETAYHSTRYNIEVVTNALNFIDREHYRNIEGLNSAITHTIDDYTTWVKLKKTARILLKLKGILT